MPPTIMRVVSADVRDAEPAHPPSQGVIRLRPRDQMPMIRHHAIGEQLDRIAFEAFGQDALKGLAVLILLEQPHAAVAAIEDMAYSAGFDGPGRAWHGESPHPDASSVNNE